MWKRRSRLRLTALGAAGGVRGRVPLGAMLALGAVVTLGAETGYAQYPGTGPRGYNPQQPTYSPYLNLARPGNVGLNYYGLVRPEVNFRNSIGGLQQDVNTLNQPYTDPTTPNTFLYTGHASQFNNLSHYYGGFNRLTGGGLRAGGGGGIGGGAGNRPQGIQAPTNQQTAQQGGNVPRAGGR